MARGRRGKEVSKKGNFFNLMTEEVPEDIAVNARNSSVQEEPEQGIEDRPVKGKVMSDTKEKKSIFKGLFNGRSRTEMEDEIGSYGDVRDEVEKYVPLEERKIIHQTLKGITSPNQIIDTAEREGLEIQNLIYLNIITKNDYKKYLSYIDAVEAEIEREKKLEIQREKAEQQRRADNLKKKKEEEERKRLKQEEEEARKEEERQELLKLKGMFKTKEEVKHTPVEDERPKLQPEPEETNSFDFSTLKMEDSVGDTQPDVKPQPKEVIEGDEIVRYKGTVDEIRIKIGGDEDFDEEELGSALDSYIGGTKKKKPQTIYNTAPDKTPDLDLGNLEERLRSKGLKEEEYNQDITDKFSNVKTEEESIKETEEYEEVDKMDIYIVGDLYKILKNSGVGGKTPSGYKITPDDEAEHFNENLRNYNIVIIETEEGLNDYLFSKNNLLIVTQDVGKYVKNRLAGFLRGTGEEEGNYHRIVTIKGSDTEVSHSSIEDAIMLTKESLDRYYSTHPIENYYNTKKGFNSLDDFLDD